MRKCLRLIFGRGFLTVLCLLVQLVALWGALHLCGSVWGTWFRIVMAAASWITVILIVSDRSEEAYKTAWCILVLALPIFGLLCYILLGRSRNNQALQQLHDKAQDYLKLYLPDNREIFTQLQLEAPEAATQSAAIRQLGGGSLWYGGETRWFSSGESCFSAMLEDLRQATKSIWLEYFIIRPGVMWDSILTILRQKAEKGVDVRLIYDDFGCLPGLPRNYPQQLQKMHIACCVCNPFTPVLSACLGSRDHRKLMILDGTVCYMGGINLSDEYIGLRQRCGHWKDGALRIEGAAVYGCSALFLSMWSALSGECTPPPKPIEKAERYCYMQPFGDSPLFPQSVGRSAIVGMIGRAQERVWLMTPYFVPDEALCDTLCLMAASGVDVRIITPATGDKWYTQALTRAHDSRLLESGVKIYEYAPGFLHAKVCCADGKIAVIGTVNLDYRSFYLQFENGIWLYGKNVVADIEQDICNTLEQCRPITPSLCAKVPWFQRTGRAILRLFAPLV